VVRVEIDPEAHEVVEVPVRGEDRIGSINHQIDELTVGEVRQQDSSRVFEREDVRAREPTPRSRGPGRRPAPRTVGSLLVKGSRTSPRATAAFSPASHSPVAR
jgi:hypothetical protein